MDTIERINIDGTTDLAMAVANFSSSLLLVGPPRSGKTTVARNMAERLGYRLRHAWAGSYWEDFASAIANVARDEMLHVDLDSMSNDRRIFSAINEIIRSNCCLMVATVCDHRPIVQIVNRFISIKMDDHAAIGAKAPIAAMVRYEDQIRRAMLGLRKRTDLAVQRVAACMPSRS